MQLRDYQQNAIRAVYSYLRNHTGNPCCVLPTGSGKTPVIATVCKDAVQRWKGRVLVLAHVKELLVQAVEKLRSIAPEIPVGLYSAGLGARDTEQNVIVAGIQSVYNKPEVLGKFDLIIVDECHLIPPDGDGMYRTLLGKVREENPKVRLIGFTATPYRTSTGLICGPDNLLNQIVYEESVGDLINRGFLTQLISRGTRHNTDFSGLHLRGGEFIPEEIESLLNKNEKVNLAVRETLDFTKDRKKILLFCTSVDHAKKVQKGIQQNGLSCGLVVGEMSSGERDSVLRQFKNDGQVDIFGDPIAPMRYLVNVNVLTTGFDAPNIDCVVLLRPTNSPGLYSQMVGRGLRTCPEKENCLILDYGGNVLRHGPINAVHLKGPVKAYGDKKPQTPFRQCPNCQLIVPVCYTLCPECQTQLVQPRTATHDETAGNADIIGVDKTEEFDVQNIVYSIHTKKGADENYPKTMRVDYFYSLSGSKAEWVCPEHTGFARQKFEKWWKKRSNHPLPETAAGAVEIARGGGLAPAKKITVETKAGERYGNITKYELGDIPDVEEFQPAPDLGSEYKLCCECEYYYNNYCTLRKKKTDPNEFFCEDYLEKNGIPF